MADGTRSTVLTLAEQMRQSYDKLLKCHAEAEAEVQKIEGDLKKALKKRDSHIAELKAGFKQNPLHVFCREARHKRDEAKADVQRYRPRERKPTQPKKEKPKAEAPK